MLDVAEVRLVSSATFDRHLRGELADAGGIGDLGGVELDGGGAGGHREGDGLGTEGAVGEVLRAEGAEQHVAGGGRVDGLDGGRAGAVERRTAREPSAAGAVGENRRLVALGELAAGGTKVVIGLQRAAKQLRGLLAVGLDEDGSGGGGKDERLAGGVENDVLAKGAKLGHEVGDRPRGEELRERAGDHDGVGALDGEKRDLAEEVVGVFEVGESGEVDLPLDAVGAEEHEVAACLAVDADEAVLDAEVVEHALEGLAVGVAEEASGGDGAAEAGEHLGNVKALAAGHDGFVADAAHVGGEEGGVEADGAVERRRERDGGKACGHGPVGYRMDAGLKSVHERRMPSCHNPPWFGILPAASRSLSMNTTSRLCLLGLCLVSFATAAAASHPVFDAITNGDMDKVSELLKEDKNATLSAREDHDVTALHFAVFRKQLEIAHALVRAGADIKAVDDQGATPLAYAVIGRDVDCCRLLLRKGADPNAAAYHGSTPLHIAARFGETAIVDLLLASGADPSRKMSNGRLPGDIAKERGFDGLAAKLGTTPAASAALPVAAPTPKAPVAAPVIAGAQPTPRYVPVAAVAPAELPADRQGWIRKSNFDRSVYYGEVRKDKPHGTGILTMLDRSRYEGQWRNGHKEGTGRYTYPNGDEYAGSWKNDVPHGEGVFQFANGGHVNGTWRNGLLMDGSGIFISSKGNSYSCVWEGGECVSRVELPGQQPVAE